MIRFRLPLFAFELRADSHCDKWAFSHIFAFIALQRRKWAFCHLRRCHWNCIFYKSSFMPKCSNSLHFRARPPFSDAKVRHWPNRWRLRTYVLFACKFGQSFSESAKSDAFSAKHAFFKTNNFIPLLPSTLACLHPLVPSFFPQHFFHPCL